MKSLTMLGLCGVLVAGCTSTEDRLFFDGQLYNAKLRKVDRQLDTFTNSDIVWTEGPDVEEGALTIDKDTLILQGSCRNVR